MNNTRRSQHISSNMGHPFTNKVKYLYNHKMGTMACLNRMIEEQQDLVKAKTSSRQPLLSRL
jgi:hypothetical protein